MANPVYQTYTTTGAKTPIAINNYQTPANLRWAAWLVDTTTATYGVQYTLDDIQTNANARWFDTTEAPTGTSATKDGGIGYPITYIRVNIASITGTLEFKVLQGLQYS